MVYPAIDLRRGRVVRLRQGDPRRETVYGDDPLDIAHHWQHAGAEWVHVVNLDGALGDQQEENQIALERVLRSGLQVQFGGGLRDIEAIDRILSIGVRRAVIGTAAVRNPSLLEAALASFGPERVALAIDSKHGEVRTHGWQRGSGMTALELARGWSERGGHWVIFTDVARDGMGTGLNLEGTVALARESGLGVIGSGGVATLRDVRRAHAAGLRGVIIGRALYDGQIDLEDALRVGRTDDAG